jgi:membrane-associated phospholipid phosphatase
MKAVREIALLISFVLLPVLSFAQSADTQPGDSQAASAVPTPTPTHDISFGKSLVRDQKAIWSSPFHVKKSDAHWLVPLAVTTAGLIVADRHTSGFVDRNGSLLPVSHKVSLLGSAYGVVGTAAGFYLVGHATHDRHAQQTGRLMTEALIGTTIVTEVLKYATERRRPDFANGRGQFFEHGSSFPSGHSSSVWSVATVLAMQYKRNPWIKYGAFAVATAVGLSRYSGRNHFLSDVLTGSAIGYGVGRFVYNNR